MQQADSPGDGAAGAPQTTDRVDIDLHLSVPTLDDLRPRLASYWREATEVTGFHGSRASQWPTALRDRWRLPGTPLAQVQQVLGEFGSAIGIVHCDYGIDAIRNPDAAAEFCRVINDWMIEEVLEQDSRLRGSLLVPTFTPDIAAAEIRRVGGHPAIAQVSLPVRSTHPWGRRDYYPLFDAMAEQGLVGGLRYGGQPGHAPTSSGWPTYQAEDYAAMARVAQSQLISMIAEGLFVRYEDLRIGVTGCGASWLPSFLWRYDKDWKGLRREVPWVKKRPSEYVRARCIVSTAGADIPLSDPDELDMWVGVMDGADILAFGSDYPHSTAAEGHAVAAAPWPEDAATQIFAGNARATYGLGEPEDTTR